jgi:hypothetical protein
LIVKEIVNRFPNRTNGLSTKRIYRYSKFFDKSKNTMKEKNIDNNNRSDENKTISNDVELKKGDGSRKFVIAER